MQRVHSSHNLFFLQSTEHHSCHSNLLHMSDATTTAICCLCQKYKQAVCVLGDYYCHDCVDHDFNGEIAHLLLRCLCHCSHLSPFDLLKQCSSNDTPDHLVESLTAVLQKHCAQ